MTNKKSTKRALLVSLLSMLLCVSMLVGTTFAWFTDSVTSNNNLIVSGNLDVEFYYQNYETDDWTKINGQTNIFKKDALWEPGHTEVVKLKITNEGSLALKYNLGVNIVDEQGSFNDAGEAFLLSDYIYYGVTESEGTAYADYTRDSAIAAVEDEAKLIKDKTSIPGSLESGQYVELTMVVYMPTTVGNEANHRTGEVSPSITLGLNVVATQFTFEEDSFDDQYDADAYLPIPVLPEHNPSALRTSPLTSPPRQLRTELLR